MMMGNVNISSSDPTIGALLKLLTDDPKAVRKLLEQLQASITEHRREATLARDQVAAAWNAASAAEKLLEDANAKLAEATRRELAVAAREQNVAAREAKISQIRTELGL
jgi:hypothetical protein